MKNQLFTPVLVGLFIFITNNLFAQASIYGYVGCVGGPPFEDVIVTCGSYSDTTDNAGNYEIDNIPAGYYMLSFNIPGSPPASYGVELLDGMAVNADYVVICGNFAVEPLSLELWLEPNATETEILTLSNTGSAPVQWSAEINYSSPGDSKGFFDLIFQVPLDGAAMEKGVTCDNEYIYTTDPYGFIRRYAFDGTFIEILSLGGYDDLAWDGYYFYGCNGSSIIYCLDLNAQTVVSTFTAPGNISTITYNSDDNVFYGTSWNEDLMVFDASGALINSAPLPPDNPVYTGLTYDNCGPDGPNLWAYGSVGPETHIIHLYQLPSLQLTNFAANMNDILIGTLNNGSGGLFVSTHIEDGICALGGIVQGEWMWTVELAETWEWLSIEPASGTVNPGETEEVEVHFDATDLLPWTYEAEINFVTIPNIAAPTVDVEMTIEGQPGMYWLEASQSCTDIILDYETIPPGCTMVDSFHIYKDNLYYATAFDFQFSDTMQIPGEIHDYYVTGYFFNGWESNATNLENVFVNLPSGLEPNNFSGSAAMVDSIFCISWDIDACVDPDYFNIYRDLFLIDQVEEATYCDTLQWPGSYTYYVTAHYYFGESMPSNTITYEWIETLVPNFSEYEFTIYPNPVKNEFIIDTDIPKLQLSIYNATGQLMIQKEIFTTKTVDISCLEPGIYYFIISTSDYSWTKKIIIH